MKVTQYNEKERDEIEKNVELLNISYNEIRDEVKDLRKSGKDTLIVDLIIKSYKSKVEYYKVTMDEKALDSIKGMLKNAKIEIDSLSKEKDINIKKEIEEMMQKEEGKVIKEV